MTTREMAQAMGRRGGRARAARLPAAERKRIAMLGAAARRASLEMARRIESNFGHAAMIAELRGRAPIVRTRSFDGRLPGVYRRLDG
jgi:hypothetical protein